MLILTKTISYLPKIKTKMKEKKAESKKQKRQKGV